MLFKTKSFKFILYYGFNNFEIITIFLLCYFYEALALANEICISTAS